MVQMVHLHLGLFQPEPGGLFPILGMLSPVKVSGIAEGDKAILQRGGWLLCWQFFSFPQSFLGKPGCSHLKSLPKSKGPSCLIFWVLREIQIPAVGYVPTESLCTI